jgi:hypothetical protein
LILLLALSGSARAESPLEREAREQYADAQKKFDAADFAAALQSFQRSFELENNSILGGSQGAAFNGVYVHALSSTNEIDLHSNNIRANGTLTGCTSAIAVAFGFGTTQPASARGLLRNNILLADKCGSNGVDVMETLAGAAPRIIENNDFVPSRLYHSAAGGDLTQTQINALPGASANLSVDPMFVPGDYHLDVGSMCIDHGTFDGMPPDDYDGTPRPVGTAPDIGRSEKK